MSTGSLADFERLMRRAAIMDALSLAAEFFLNASPETWEKNVLMVLERIGEARGSDRVYACKNKETPEGKQVFLKYEWKKTGERQVNDGEKSKLQSYADLGLAEWAQLLSTGEVISRGVKSLRAEEKCWNVSETAQSLVLVPVFVGAEWWGYIGFESNVEGDEVLTKAEIDALKAVATTFGAAIRRKRMEEELKLEKESVEQKVMERTRELESAKRELQRTLTISREEKARLTASIHSLSLGFLMTDVYGEVLLFNHAVNDILSTMENAWTMQALMDKLGKIVDVQTRVRESVQKVQEIKVDDIQYLEKWIRLYLTPIKMMEEDGRVIGVVILLEDVTEAKRLQQTRDEFFAVASHELRTPLTAIKGNSMLLRRLVPQIDEQTESREIITDIETSTDRLTSMVNEYLDVSRLEMNKVTVSVEIIKAVELVSTVMRDLEVKAREKKLAWELQLPDGTDLAVKADRGRMEQVLINLLGNAIKYTDQGGVYVKVVKAKGVVKICIYDTGEGITPEDQGALFQKFKRVGDRVYARDMASGSGMGLYISRLLAEAMGGKVYLEKSEAGKGSGFVLELPEG